MSIAAEEETGAYHVYLQNISWQTYDRLLKDLAEQNVRLTYDQGELEIMSPLPEHENVKSLIGRFIEALGEELDMPSRSLGSTTLKRKSLLIGLEPDECFYIQHERDVRGKKRLDLKGDPPPDLILEVDLSYRTVNKQRVYAAMRVPEIWNYDSGRLKCLHLRRGKYEEAAKSLAFPMLRPADMEPFIKMLDDTDDSTIGKKWRAWVRKNLR